MKYYVELSCYVPGCGFSYTTDLDPIVTTDITEECKLARLYAEEFELPNDGNDYRFQVFDESGCLVSEIWDFEIKCQKEKIENTEL